jgi:hypothetical protein
MTWSVSGRGWLTIETKDQVVHICLPKVREITEFRKTAERDAFIRIDYDDARASFTKIEGIIDLDLRGLLFR